MRLVFMGTPDFAVAALEALIQAGHEIAAVYTRKDTPKNRGMKLLPPPVKIKAMEYGIPVFQPKGLKQQETWEQLRALRPDAIIVAAYGRLLPPQVLEIPKYGCLNIHASLLPKYRGASPISACILQGETVSGVTIMQMDAGLDTGDILLPAALNIEENEPCGSLHDRLAQLGGKAIVQALAQLEEGALAPMPQPEQGSCYAPMIQTGDCLIDFCQTARQVCCAIRAYDPQPGAFSYLGGGKLKLFGGVLAQEKGSLGCPGEILSVDRQGALVACGHGAVRVEQVQGAGGKRMAADAFFRGHAALLEQRFSMDRKE